MKLKRFNQGFGFFGLLEQCSNGKLMLADEVSQYMSDMKDKEKELQRQIAKCQRELAQYELAINDTNATISEYSELIKALIITSTIGWAIIIFCLVRFSFFG